MENCNKFLSGYDNKDKLAIFDPPNNIIEPNFTYNINEVYKPNFLPKFLYKTKCGIVGNIPDPNIKFYMYKNL